MKRNRITRLKNFSQQEITFLNTIRNKKIPSKLLDNKKVVIGSKRMGGQLITKSSKHLKFLTMDLKIYMKRLNSGEINPKKYFLTQLISGKKTQEYVYTPSVEMLWKYLDPTGKLLLKPNEYSLCKTFVNKYKKIGFSKEKFEVAYEELINHIGIMAIPKSNVLVMGYIKEGARTNGGKIRFAVCDGA
jgi:hypothetical protein